MLCPLFVWRKVRSGASKARRNQCDAAQMTELNQKQEKQ